MLVVPASHLFLYGFVILMLVGIPEGQGIDSVSGCPDEAVFINALFFPKDMDVSKNRGAPQIIHFNRVFHYKPSILGYHYFWKHPYQNSKIDTRCNLIFSSRKKDRPSSSGVSNRLMIPGKTHPKHFTKIKNKWLGKSNTWFTWCLNVW